jgi:ligand-binding sensor domain-containing protein
LIVAQTQDLIFDHLTVDQGLSNNTVLTILQDSRGFMWFGTEDGLNKYDGYNFTVYRHDPDDILSISGNWIWTLQESHYGGKHVLWVGTKYSGLNRLDLETEQFTHFRHDPKDLQSLSQDQIASIFEDSYGELWIGTFTGINKFDRKTEKFIRYQHDPDDPTSLSENKYCTIHESLTADSSILWIGTWGGLNRFNRKTQKFTRYLYDRHNQNSLSNNNIAKLFTDASGMLWIMTQNGGLNKFNIETEQFIRFQPDPDNPKSLAYKTVTSIVESRFQGNSVLWVSTNQGLERLDLATNQFTHHKNIPNNHSSLSDNNLWTMYKDKAGIIWIGTWGAGVDKFDPSRQKFVHYRQEPGNPNSLSHNYIWSITQSKYYGPNVFWIGTKDGGLNKFNRDKGRFTHYRHDSGNSNSLCHDMVFVTLESRFQGRDELWIGTLDGLDKFDLKTKTFTHYKHDPDDPSTISNYIVRSICEDYTGILWVGTRNGGINKFDRDSGKFTRFRLNIGQTLSIIEDNRGIVWAGTGSGLLQYNSDTNNFTYYGHDPENEYSLSNNCVLSLYEDKSSRFWIGTTDGLNLFDRKTNKFTRYNEKDGLPSKVINGILEDDHGNLWLNTNHGLSKFNPEEKTFWNYDLYDGLQSNQFVVGASCLSKKGEMLFGGVNGFNIFHPDKIKDNPHIPEVHLTDFQIFNKKVDVKTGEIRNADGNYYLPKHISNISEITLSYKENVFSFEFAALDYQSPQKNQYAYKMEGVDPDWVRTDASRRYVTYTQLDPGEYTFRVKASNNDGLWNDEGTSVKIIITPPWWQTEWAYVSYFILILFTLYALRTYDKKRQRLKQELKMEHFEAEKLREVDHMKSRFFTNISHEFRTPLTLIKGPIKQLLSGKIKGNLKDQYQIISRNSDRLLQLVNQLLDLSRLESGRMKLQAARGDIVTFLQQTVANFESLATNKGIILNLKTPSEPLMSYFDRDKLEKIISNLLSNAFKFTPEGGKIILECGMQEKSKIPDTKRLLPVDPSGPNPPRFGQNPKSIIIPSSQFPIPIS